jgi:hypothetical protein
MSPASNKPPCSLDAVMFSGASPEVVQEGEPHEAIREQGINAVKSAGKIKWNLRPHRTVLLVDGFTSR